MNDSSLRRSTAGWHYQRTTTSPGEILKQEFLEPYGLSQNRLAGLLRIPVARIGNIVRGKQAVTPDMALRLSRFFGNSPEFWLHLQQLHDLTEAQRVLGAIIKSEVPVYRAGPHKRKSQSR